MKIFYRQSLVTLALVSISYLATLRIVNAQDIAFVDQQDTTVNKNYHTEEDFGGYFRRILHKPVDSAKAAKNPKVAVLPSFGYNASLGAIIGAKVSGVKQLADPKNTSLSAFGLKFPLTSKKVIGVQARHNIFRSGNKWNFQGNWQFLKFLVADSGVGTGNNYITSETEAHAIIHRDVSAETTVCMPKRNDFHFPIPCSI